MEIKSHRIKICIIEDNKQICRIMEEYINKSEDLELAGVARDGAAGGVLLRDEDFDAAIIDIILPFRDGISVIGNYKTANKHTGMMDAKVFIMLTAVSHEALIRTAFDNGADYFMLKPFDTEILFNKVRELYYSKNEICGKSFAENYDDVSAIEDFADKLLYKLEIHRNLKGFLYLKSAIHKAICDKGVLDGITKILYPAIAKENASTPIRVERAIRHAINESWTLSNSKKYVRLLEQEAFLDKRPTNRAFILAASEAYKRSNITF